MSWISTYTTMHWPTLAKAAAWYEAREPGLGAEFSEAVWLAIDELVDKPLVHRIRNVRFQVRWFLPKRFPYRIVYNDLIRVVAVTHSARHDRAWKGACNSGMAACSAGVTFADSIEMAHVAYLIAAPVLIPPS